MEQKTGSNEGDDLGLWGKGYRGGKIRKEIKYKWKNNPQSKLENGNYRNRPIHLWSSPFTRGIYPTKIQERIHKDMYYQEESTAVLFVMTEHWVQPKHWLQTLYKTREAMIPDKRILPNH